MRIPVSVLILTKDEERDLPECLESVYWSDDIHVYDYYSSDNTVLIAREKGAKVTFNPSSDTSKFFGGNESEYRNWGLKNIPFQYSWILQLDADERATPELVKEINRVINTSHEYVAFNIQRRDFYLGTWLKHVQATPYYIRLFHHEKIHFERLINPVTIVDGSVGKLNEYIDHFPFSKGLTHWVNRHNSYSTLEAKQIHQNQNKKNKTNIVKAFRSKDFQSLRYHQKELFYKLPFRPLVKFVILFFLKRGFLDGKAGFTYAILQSFYELMIILKVNENKNFSKN